jgi:hypothetical protein
MAFANTRQQTIDAILAHFMALPLGGVTTYDTLSGVAGERIGPSFYPLRRAIQLARDKHSVLIRNERGVGFVRTGTFDERRDMLDQRRGKVRRQALTGIKETAAVMRGSNPTNAEMMALVKYQGAFAVSHMTTGGSQATSKKITGTLFEEPRAKPEDIPA